MHALGTRRAFRKSVSQKVWAIRGVVILAALVVGSAACGDSEVKPSSLVLVAGAGGASGSNTCPLTPPEAAAFCNTNAQCSYGVPCSTGRQAICVNGQWEVRLAGMVCPPKTPPASGTCPATIPTPRTPCGFVALAAPSNAAPFTPFVCNYETPGCGLVAVTCELAQWSSYDISCLTSGGAAGAGGATDTAAGAGGAPDAAAGAAGASEAGAPQGGAPG
jgi:hypothetical protein